MANVKNEVKKTVEEKVEDFQKTVEAIVAQDISKSKRMIELYNLGLTISQIAKAMGTRYNFAYNVISNECGKNGVQMRSSGTQGKVKAAIIEQHKKGLTVADIARKLRTNYSYAHSVVAKYKKEEEAKLAAAAE